MRTINRRANMLDNDAFSELEQVLAKDRDLRLVEDGIYSVLPDASREHQYDNRAMLYDLVVSTRLYNFVMWGTSPFDYMVFAREAVTSSPDGRFLDAGCGSMLFTAPIYLECNRVVIAIDQSLSMLRRARNRLIGLSGSSPRNVLLLQADLADLPFYPKTFSTTLCMNVLHHLENAATVILRLKKLLTDSGHLYLTSLVSNDRFVGDCYLNFLYATGQLVRPRSSLELREMLVMPLKPVVYRLKGNMAFAIA